MLGKVILFGGLSASLAALGPANAQVTVDLSKISCRQFTSYAISDPRYIAVWLNGYNHGKRTDTVVETEMLKGKTEELKAYCRKNQQMPLMQAAEELLGKKE